MLLLGCASSEDEDAETPARRCERIRNHLVELRLATSTGVDREAHRVVLRDALGDGFLTSCKELTAAQMRCLLGATDLTAVDGCTPSR